MKRYLIVGLADSCPLCIEPMDGRSKGNGKSMFQVACEGGGYCGPICAPHLVALLKLDEPKQQKPQPQLPAAQPAVNSPAPAVVK